ncbi:MAG: rRNA pseudouridine synthase [Bacteroidota bacterium]|nr:rRNA pseudouridine synthase [Bacteroidota bacterium]
MKRKRTEKPISRTQKDVNESTRLNKYIANAGVCSRRDADELIKNGRVKINGEVIKEMGTQVRTGDEVSVNNKILKPKKNNVYILLNKPKGFITTTNDPEGRDTVMDLIANATDERVFPVGRLDRNTTGLLLLTNDGDLAQELIHPSKKIKKVYGVTLDKPFTQNDFKKMMEGIELEDGKMVPDDLAYTDDQDKRQVGIEIHTGRNRIVRRLFEALGYEVEKLDRVLLGNLTKRNVPRGKWRLLTNNEVRILKSGGGRG